MPLLCDIVNYCNHGPSGNTGPTGPNTTGFWAVQQWNGPTAVTPGSIVRNRTPAVGSERCFISITGGTAAASEPSWTLTRGALNTDSTTAWMEATGIAALNGDLANTVTWAQLKAVSSPTLGTVIKANDGSSIQICSTQGTLGASQPSFSATPGVRTPESGGTTVWISLGTSFPVWASPHARVVNATTTNWAPFGMTGAALSAVAGRGTTYVGDNHAEVQSTAITIAPGLVGNDTYKIVCIDHTKINPTGGNLTTTANVTTSGPGIHLNITPASGGLYFYGVSLQAGPTGTTNTGSLLLTPTDATYYFDQCGLILGNTSASSVIQLSNTNSGALVLNGTSMKFGAVGQYVDVATNRVLWQNSTLLAPSSAVPTVMFGDSGVGRFANVLLEGIDMSAFTGQLNSSQVNFNFRDFTVKDCKLNTSMTVTNPSNAWENYQFVGCEVGATGTAYKSSRYSYEATETTEISITRVGGAVDPANNAQSRKIATTATPQWLRPYRAEAMAVYNSNIAQNVTVTVFGTWNSGSVPNNDDIWIEVEYLGTATYPLGTIVNTTKSSLLATNAAVTSDSSTWNGGGSGGGWSPFKFSVTLSAPQPQFAGLIHVRVRAAKASSTFYIDPKVVLS